MKYKGTLVVVKDCRRALRFYQDLFGFELIRDNDGNMELSGGLYLQEQKYWESFTGKSVVFRNNRGRITQIQHAFFIKNRTFDPRIRCGDLKPGLCFDRFQIR